MAFEKLVNCGSTVGHIIAVAEMGLQQVPATHRPLVPSSHRVQRVGHDVLPRRFGGGWVDANEVRLVDSRNPVPGLARELVGATELTGRVHGLVIVG